MFCVYVFSPLLNTFCAHPQENAKPLQNKTENMNGKYNHLYYTYC